MDRNIKEFSRSVVGFGHGHNLDYELRLFQHFIKHSVVPACPHLPPRRSRWEMHFGGIMAGVRHHKIMDHQDPACHGCRSNPLRDPVAANWPTLGVETAGVAVLFCVFRSRAAPK